MTKFRKWMLSALGSALLVIGVVIHGITPPKVTLNWTQSTSPNLANNCIYRGLTTGGPYTQLFCSASPSTQYVDSTVTRGTTYFYVVTAIDINGIESINSNETKAIVISVTPPTNVTSISQ